jgi:ABC-type polysaccharide/polyol phosphate export permease
MRCVTEPAHLWKHYLHIVLAMGWSDFVLKYRGSVLGYFWSLLAPLAKFLVILAVFRPLVGAAIPQYSLYLFLGIIIWEYFALTTVGCMNMLREKASLIQQVLFPRVLLIFTVGWSTLLVFATYLLVFFLFALFMGMPWPQGIWYMPLIVLQMSLLSLGVGMLLSSYCLKYQDIRHLWEIALQILFWLTPVMYAPRLLLLHQDAPGALPDPSSFPLSSAFLAFVQFQPLSVLIDDARRVLLYDVPYGIPSLSHFAAFTAVCAAVFLLGLLTYLRRSRYFLEEY